jgi:hypothetical protein
MYNLEVFYVRVTVHRDKFLYNNQLDAVIAQIYFGMKLYMFRTVPLSIIQVFRQRKSSTNLYDIYHC